MEADLEVSTDPTRLDVGLVCEFLQRSYWATGRARSVIERSMKNSLCFGAYLAGRQVAFARVVSDRAVFAYLMDVFVLPEFRGPLGVIENGPHQRTGNAMPAREREKAFRCG